MEPILPFLKRATADEERHKLADYQFRQGEYIKALEIIEDLISIRGIDNVPPTFPFLQGSIFLSLANKVQNSDVKFAFLLGSVECFMEEWGERAYSVIALFRMADQLGSALYHKKAMKRAKERLSDIASYDQLSFIGQKLKTTLEKLIGMTETEIRRLYRPRFTEKKSDPKLRESKEFLDTKRSNQDTVAGEKLRSYWAGLNVEKKRNFMKVSIDNLSAYAARVYGREGQNVLEQVLDSARINRKWKFWMCRTCSQKFFYLKKFKNHLEQKHAAKFKPSTTKHMAQRVDEGWGGMISVADWEPVDSVASAEMIKTRLEFVKEFVYENGWSKDWPLAADEERSKLLMEIQSILVLFWLRKILSCSIRDWMIHFSIKHLARFEVSEYTLTTECRLVETPQIICFLECDELNQILDLLKLIKCERDDGKDLVCKAVDSLCGGMRVKEKIDFDNQFSVMLLDKRLLRGKISSFDDEGTIDVGDHNVHYAKTHPQGDDIITWLLDYPLLDKGFGFPKSIRAHNLDIWVAVQKAIHFTCRALGSKYAKKLQLLRYDAALIEMKNICINEDERRRNIPEDQWNVYASLLCDKCEENLSKDKDYLATEIFLCAVRDVLQGASNPTFDFPDIEDCLKLILGHKNLSDDIVLKSIDLLKSVVTNKGLLADSKILLVENSRISLLNDLIRLSVFDYRSYILDLLKRFLQEELDGTVNMDAKARVAAAEADLLSEKKQEKEKKSGSKKKKHKSNKRTSTSMSSLPDQNVELESSVNLERGVTSPSLKTAEEDSMEPEDTVSSERGQLEISSNTGNQEEAAKDMQNMSGQNSLSEHLELAIEEGAVRCNLALDMTLKALCNIMALKDYWVHNRHQSPNNLEEQVPCALHNFFAAFASKQIKEEGVYIYLMHDLLASLEEVHSMSSDAAELLVSILEFWPYWKNPQIESSVTSLFSLDEYERMSCSKCRKKPNYPEQSSYGIVMAADSIRDLKCAFGNIKFEEILKVIRMEDKMLCDIKTEGCGKENFVHHIISRCPPIFTIVLEWEKNETEKEISETTMALYWEIDISRLYEVLEEPKYRLVSMVGYAEEEEEYVCLAYKKNRWVSFRHKAFVKEAVGNWKTVVRFCGSKKVRPEILFYEAV